MFDKTSDAIIEAMIQNRTISEEDRELYRYGIQQGLLAFMNLFTYLLIGLACRVFLQSVIFIVAYFPLRHYAGGFHAKTPLRCYLYSIVIITATFLAIKFVTWTNFICGLILLIAMICILLLSPMDCVNKPLDSLEKEKYRKRSFLIATFEICIAIISLYTNQRTLSVSITVSTLVTSLMLLCGAFNNRTKRL